MSAEDLARTTDLAPIRGETLLRGRALSSAELEALYATCRARTRADLRDGALLTVLYGCGLRRSEAVALDSADYDVLTGSLTVRAGKGRKARLVYASGGWAVRIDSWLAVRGEEPGPLFAPVNKAGVMQLRRLTDQAVYSVLARRGRRAGVRPFSPHDLRRTFVSDLLDAGADVSVVQRLAGHANVTTTSRYDRRGEVAKRKASALLDIPA